MNVFIGLLIGFTLGAAVVCLGSNFLTQYEAFRRIEVGPKIYQGDAKGRARSSAFFDQAINITYTFSQEPLI